MKLSLVVPCYNEEESITLFYDYVDKLDLSHKYELEFIFIDDGSKDNTLKKCRELSQKDVRVRYVSFSRNFGKEAALLAGLRRATGDYVVTMDVDLQHPPALLEKMLKELTQNNEYESVAAYRTSRDGESFIRSFLSKKFYSFMNMLSDVKLEKNSTDYRIMSRKFVNAVLSLAEVNRFTKGIYAWVGFETKFVSFENVEREAGTTKWSIWNLFKYSLEGLSSFSTVPLHFASIAGIICSLLAFLYILYVVGKTLIFGEPVKGYPSLICLIMLVGGFQMFCTGILGFYLSKMYREIKKRPVYIEKESK